MEILVVAGMEGIVSLTELESEECVCSPWDIRVDINLVGRLS